MKIQRATLKGLSNGSLKIINRCCIKNVLNLNKLNKISQRFNKIILKKRWLLSICNQWNSLRFLPVPREYSFLRLRRSCFWLGTLHYRYDNYNICMLIAHVKIFIILGLHNFIVGMNNPETSFHTIDTATMYSYNRGTNQSWNMSEYRTPKLEVDANM